MFPTDLLASVALWVINLTSANGTVMMYYTSISIRILSSRTLLITQGNQNIHRSVVTNYVLGKSRAHLRCIRNEEKCSLLDSLFSFIWKRIPPDFCKQKQNFILGKWLYFAVTNILFSFFATLCQCLFPVAWYKWTCLIFLATHFATVVLSKLCASIYFTWMAFVPSWKLKHKIISEREFKYWVNAKHIN